MNSMAEHRRRIEPQLRRNPGLKAGLGEAIEEAYESARYRASTETAIEVEALPLSCPWDFEEINRSEHWL
jgi:hypothetical protein